MKHKNPSETKKEHCRLLTIAASDSGGGAGIQADLKTFSALGCFGTSAITGLTAQNTVSIKDIYPIPAKIVAEQIDAVIEDIGVDAVKIGMVYTKEVIQAVANRLKAHKIEKIVLDPVMVSKSGVKLLRDDALETYRKELIPLALVFTPNIPEACILLGKDLKGRSDIEAGCRELMRLGPGSVVIKGGHSEDSTCADCLCLKEPVLSSPKARLSSRRSPPKGVSKDQNGNGEKLYWFEEKRIDTANTHGTGCTFSSAIAVYLAKGYSIWKSVKKSKEYITKAIQSGKNFRLGKGRGTVHHFYPKY